MASSPPAIVKPRGTKFAPGVRQPGAGRPKGAVNKIKIELAAMAREHTEEALRAIVKAMRRLDRIISDDTVEIKDAISAASAQVHTVNLLLERGYGRPHQAVHVDAPPGTVIVPVLNVFASEPARPDDRPVSAPQAAPRPFINGH